MKFVIYAPPYPRTSAGGRSLHRLCHWLRVYGNDARLLDTGGDFAVHPTWESALIRAHEVAADDVAIYPEIIHGNPLCTRRVVRWVLNHPGAMGGPTLFEPGERVYTPFEWFVDGARGASARVDDYHGLLYCSTTDPREFYPKNRTQGQVSRPLLYVGKAQGVKASVDAFLDANPNTIVINGSFTDAKLGWLLRNCHSLWTFDAQTMLMYEAALCGASVVIYEANVWRAYAFGDYAFDLAMRGGWERAITDFYHPTGVERLADGWN